MPQPYTGAVVTLLNSEPKRNPKSNKEDTMPEPSAKQLDYPNKKQCLGNFCTLHDPDCERCRIDEALDKLQNQKTITHNQGEQNVTRPY